MRLGGRIEGKRSRGEVGSISCGLLLGNLYILVGLVCFHNPVLTIGPDCSLATVQPPRLLD